MAYVARYSQDDFPDEERLVVQTPQGQATVIPKSARRLDAASLEAYADLMTTGLQLAELEGEALAAVARARELGVSWALIGHALGVTGEGARKRYGDV